MPWFIRLTLTTPTLASSSGLTVRYELTPLCEMGPSCPPPFPLALFTSTYAPLLPGGEMHTQEGTGLSCSQPPHSGGQRLPSS